jgi:hypothetical protein
MSNNPPSAGFPRRKSDSLNALTKPEGQRIRRRALVVLFLTLGTEARDSLKTTDEFYNASTLIVRVGLCNKFAVVRAPPPSSP